jgi:hypothetical protein
LVFNPNVFSSGHLYKHDHPREIMAASDRSVIVVPFGTYYPACGIVRELWARVAQERDIGFDFRWTLFAIMRVMLVLPRTNIFNAVSNSLPTDHFVTYPETPTPKVTRYESCSQVSVRAARPAGLRRRV